MLTKEDINNACSNSGLRAFEITEAKAGSINLQTNDIQEFLECVKLMGSKAVFYCFEYYDSTEYEICKDAIEHIVGNPSKGLIEKVENYNESTSLLDFSRPCGINMIATSEGIGIGFTLKDEWIEIDDSDVALENLAREYEEEFVAAQERADKAKKELLKEVTEIIINDQEFGYATTIALRGRYIRDFIERDGMEKYKEVLYSKNWEGEYTNPDKETVSMIYNKFKDLKKRR